jgi:hypothetical protein
LLESTLGWTYVSYHIHIYPLIFIDIH